MAGDPRFGPFCDCGNLKGKQARCCWACHVEERRGDAYWQSRTCGCGGPKSWGAARCRPCANELMRGVATFSRVQPEDHPWRRAA